MDDYVKEKLKIWSLEAFLDNFTENGIDEETFLMLKPEFIKELIPALGPRMKFLKFHENLLTVSSITETVQIKDTKALTETIEKCQDDVITRTVLVNTETVNESLNSLSDREFSSSPLSTKKFAESNFKIKEVVLNHPQGKHLHKNLTSGNISLKSRRLLCRIMVAHLIEKFGQNPSVNLKTELSKCIVKEFQSFEDKDNLGHLIWYSRGQKRPATGYLEERLRNVRKKLKKYTIDEVEKVDEPSSSGLAKILELPLVEDEIDVEVMTDWLKANTTPYNQVKEYMQLTAAVRRDWIKGHPTASVEDIFMMFPRLKDIPGMIEQDFSLLFPNNCDNLVTNWSKYCINIKQQVFVDLNESVLKELKFIPEQDNNEILENSCLYALPYLVPSCSYRIGKRTVKPSKGDVRSSFIVNVEDDIKSIEDYIEKAKISQPHVVTFGDPIQPTLCYVVIENIYFPRSSLVKAVDACFKIFYVIDLGYPQKCKRVWEVIQDSLYQIIGKEANVCNVIRAMRQFFKE